MSDGQQPRILIGHSDWVTSVAFSWDRKTLVSGSSDATIKVWNFQTGELLRTLTGHSSAVVSIAINPDGKTLASGSRDGTIKLWNLDGEMLDTLSGRHPVAFSFDGQTLVSGGEKNTLKIWQKCGASESSESTVDAVPSGEWWEVLGVFRNADADDVKRAYRRLGRQYHPDVNPSTNAKAQMQAINQAYATFEKQVSDR
ncbi:DnaJ domain-containing protein [Coleofasciculus sp. FACHB-1120]|uniref:DnaJ domain-containing protein n=1 Tax=Coleofasciculus sp. FACHB-1120 TaxID=2692783 RepID=UPI00168A14E3|nr:DnaJ domain-containing protein [Coleofasciculus sp. FACHB-1120]MBD2744912.1 DnaJ domain-containing protein [Coleofasciculus sp. FACHB-1120]